MLRVYDLIEDVWRHHRTCRDMLCSLCAGKEPQSAWSRISFRLAQFVARASVRQSNCSGRSTTFSTALVFRWHENHADTFDE